MATMCWVRSWLFFLGFFAIKQQAIYIQAPVAPKLQLLAAEPQNAANTETDRYRNSGLKRRQQKGI